MVMAVDYAQFHAFSMTPMVSDREVHIGANVVTHKNSRSIGVPVERHYVDIRATVECLGVRSILSCYASANEREELER